MQDSIGDLFSPSRLASTGYRFCVCAVVGSSVGALCFLFVLMLFSFYRMLFNG
jgi:hypothetical protein